MPLPFLSLVLIEAIWSFRHGVRVGAVVEFCGMLSLMDRIVRYSETLLISQRETWDSLRHDFIGRCK
jgi:hypothetical protein